MLIGLLAMLAQVTWNSGASISGGCNVPPVVVPGCIEETISDDFTSDITGWVATEVSIAGCDLGSDYVISNPSGTLRLDIDHASACDATTIWLRNDNCDR